MQRAPLTRTPRASATRPPPLKRTRVATLPRIPAHPVRMRKRVRVPVPVLRDPAQADKLARLLQAAYRRGRVTCMISGEAVWGQSCFWVYSPTGGAPATFDVLSMWTWLVHARWPLTCPTNRVPLSVPELQRLYRQVRFVMFKARGVVLPVENPLTALHANVAATVAWAKEVYRLDISALDDKYVAVHSFVKATLKKTTQLIDDQMGGGTVGSAGTTHRMRTLAFMLRLIQTLNYLRLVYITDMDVLQKKLHRLMLMSLAHVNNDVAMGVHLDIIRLIVGVQDPHMVVPCLPFTSTGDAWDCALSDDAARRRAMETRMAVIHRTENADMRFLANLPLEDEALFPNMGAVLSAAAEARVL